jgi:hypothetical protein
MQQEAIEADNRADLARPHNRRKADAYAEYLNEHGTAWARACASTLCVDAQAFACPTSLLTWRAINRAGSPRVRAY